MAGARIDYVELPSATAHELTRAFYGKAFGWEFIDYGPDYSATGNGVTDVGLSGDPAEALSAPLPVIRVDDLEAAFAAVTGAGGTIARPIFAFPGGRRFHFIDPGGNELAVWATSAD
ncbi:VOC family protein [Sphingomonas mesophila]|uniref:VOC family protein n=1 Tax=Sphingomonas mesophila TaxID=2303576 RepID=UPI000E57455D|nr:VOC family protein [Sphingomonas mesophila]